LPYKQKLCDLRLRLGFRRGAYSAERSPAGWKRLLLLGVASDGMFSFVEKTVRKFKSFAEGEKSDRDFYKKLSPQERLNILLKLSEHEPERRLERVYRVIKLPRR
jgi:hypothetical protein